MTETELAAYRFLIFLAIGIYLYVRPYKLLRIAAYREDLFTIRDELWDYMNQRGFDFKEPAYRGLRHMMNGFIRLAPQLNWTTPIAALLSAKWRRVPAQPRLFDLIAAVDDPELKKRLRSAELQVIRRTIRLFYLESVLGILVWPLLWARRLSRLPRLLRWSECWVRNLLYERFGFSVLEQDARRAGTMRGAVARHFASGTAWGQ